MAVVLGISVLCFSEAFACFPVEARACKLNDLCRRWRCDNTVQCLVLNKNSLRVASEVRNLAAGNLGLLRQINDRTNTARFCCSADLGKTAMVRLSTGKMVHCTYTEYWPENTKTEHAPYRTMGAGGEDGRSGELLNARARTQLGLERDRQQRFQGAPRALHASSQALRLDAPLSKRRLTARRHAILSHQQ
jgi:hypothetical protein